MTADARFATPRRDYRETIGPRIADVSRQLGMEPMPWQLQVFDVIGEILTPDECEELDKAEGSPAYRTIGIGVPRQSGKTSAALAAMVDRALLWRRWNGTRSKVVYTAQTGKDARDKFIDDMVPLLWPNKPKRTNPTPISKRIRKINEGVGSEKCLFTNNGLIILSNNSEASGHGKTLDLGIIDEAFHDTDSRREGAMTPSMNTRPWAQRIVTSTAGTAESLYWNAKTEAGRKAAQADKGHGVAWFEWSADEGASTDDEDVWRQIHPAVGHTIDIATIRDEFDDMTAQPDGEAEFRRAYLNLPTTRLRSQHIGSNAWEIVNDASYVTFPKKGNDDDKVIVVEVSGERDRASIALANIKTNTVELTDCAPGLTWIDERIATIKKKAGGDIAVAYDSGGPTMNIGKDRPDWVPLVNADVLQACMEFYDQVMAGTIRIKSDPHIDQALAGADRRLSGDRWAWSRSKSTGDIGPLMAVTLAATVRPEPPKKRRGFVMT